MTSGARIMVVEDDEIIANLITLILEKKGYHIAARVTSGEEAVLKAAEVIPDLVLMDINLNGLMDGITAGRFVFSLFHFPVIFLTGLCDDQLLERAKAAQPYGYILKPFTEKELISNIMIALHNHEIRRQYFDKFIVGDTKKLLTSLESLIITDLKGRIVFFNPYTTRLLDLSENDLMMKPSKSVLNLINDQTNEPLPDPVPEIAKQMLAVTYEFNTVLLTPAGKQKPVSVTARPLKDEQNEMIGIIIIIKEKTLAQIKMAQMKFGSYSLPSSRPGDDAPSTNGGDPS
jgi:PAS domain S-box-containing protein